MLEHCSICNFRSGCTEMCGDADTEGWLKCQDRVTVTTLSGRYSYNVDVKDIDIYVHNGVVLIKFPFPENRDNWFNSRFDNVKITECV